ncbi:hypothetical protein lbkm_2034 [Lachnospiraceae bacterium KM106-2]|nr:hypothetical protein lbkm_2034 [Lachnospiraceae bacterium KM106-2]
MNQRKGLEILIGLIALVAGVICMVMGNQSEKTPAFYLGIILLIVFVAVIITAFTANNTKEKQESVVDIKMLTQAALLAALCYIGFQFFRFDIVMAGEKTAFHFGNVFCVLAALLLGGLWGGLSGAVGMTIADFTSSYVDSSPKTFLLKLCIGLIVGFVAHKIAKISEDHDRSYVIKWSLIASICGMAFNVVADPLVGYFYKRYLFGITQQAAEVLAKMSAITTLVNAVFAVVLATMFYMALRPALKKSDLLVKIR